jgi:predicted RNase H-like nuclease (RuvC/YqgF family)
MRLLLFMCVCLTTSAGGADFKTRDGKEYRNVTVSREDPDGIVLVTESGIVKLYFSELPRAVQEQYGYDPVKAARFAAATAQQQSALEQKQQADMKALTAAKQAQYRAAEEEKAARAVTPGEELQRLRTERRLLHLKLERLSRELSELPNRNPKTSPAAERIVREQSPVRKRLFDIREREVRLRGAIGPYH